MLAAGFTADDVDKVLWRNPVEFYGQSGQLILDPIPGFDAAELPDAAAGFERQLQSCGGPGSDAPFILHQRPPC